MTPLEEYRRELDAIDRELTGLFLKRMAVTQKVGAYKRARGMPVSDDAREARILAAAAALTEDPSLQADVRALYRTILELSRRQQERLMTGETEDESGSTRSGRVRDEKHCFDWHDGQRQDDRGDPAGRQTEKDAGGHRYPH